MESQFRMIKSQQVKNRRVQIVDVNWIFDSLKTKLVGRAMNVAAACASAREPHGKAMMIMIAPVDLAGIRAGRGQLDSRRASKFSTPDHQRILQHATLLQVSQQCANRLIAFAGELAVVLLQIIMIIPGLSFSMPDLNEPDAAFEQAARAAATFMERPTSSVLRLSRTQFTSTICTRRFFTCWDLIIRN